MVHLYRQVADSALYYSFAVVGLDLQAKNCLRDTSVVAADEAVEEAEDLLAAFVEVHFPASSVFLLVGVVKESKEQMMLHRASKKRHSRPLHSVLEVLIPHAGGSARACSQHEVHRISRGVCPACMGFLDSPGLVRRVGWRADL